MLLATETYRAITGDTASTAGAVASAASAAQDLLEEDLNRVGYFESAERSEVCLLAPDGTLYPTATPITAVTGGYEVVDNVVYGAVPDTAAFTGLIDATVSPKRATVTYTGGYTQASCPEHVLRDLAWVTYAILNKTAAQQATAGTVQAQSVRLGDVAVTYGAGGAESATDVIVEWSRSTRKLRARWV